MVLNKKNQGTYVAYCLSGTTLSLREGELTLDLARLERDCAVHLDVSENAAGRLVTGPDWRYIAEIDIPARAYRITSGEADDLGFPRLYRKAVPFDPDRVIMTLWAVEV